MLFNILKSIFKSKVVKDVARNRLLNRHTPKGILLLLAGAYSFDFLSENQVNFLISLFSNMDFQWLDIYLALANFFVMFLVLMGAWLIFAKVKKINRDI
jgi:hypothetical protein